MKSLATMTHFRTKLDLEVACKAAFKGMNCNAEISYGEETEETQETWVFLQQTEVSRVIIGSDPDWETMTITRSDYPGEQTNKMLIGMLVFHQW